MSVAAPVDADLTQVEEDAEVKRPLCHVATDLRFVCGEALRRALRVEHERVGNEVVRGEVGLLTTLVELLEVAVAREAENALDDRGEDRLG